MQPGQSSEKAVFDLYRNYPFPQTTPEERRELLAFQIAKYRALGVEEAWKGRVLEVGCGTGRTMAVPRHFGTRQYVGIDQSEASLQYAKKASIDDGVSAFQPLAASLFNMPFPDNTFDLCVCWGVLHCTPEPIKGLREMVRVCRPGGFVAFFVFNPYAHWRHEIQRWRVRRKAGDDIHARFREANRIYGHKPIDQLTPPEVVQLVDRYCVPIESTHSYGELLSWLDQTGMDYWGTSPPLRMRDFLNYMQNVASLSEELGTTGGRTRFVRFMKGLARASRRLPSTKRAAGASSRPTLLHRAFWQALLAWNGRRSDQSVGSSFCGRKRPVS